MNNLTKGLEEIKGDLEKEQIMPEGIEFCDYIERCKKSCFIISGNYCGIRHFLNKWGPNYLKGIKI